MISLARLSLVREWRRFLPAVLAVGFSGLLVFMQFALLLGVFRTVSVYIDASDADLWAGSPGTLSVNIAQNIPTKSEVFLRMNPEVARVESFLWVLADVRLPGRPSASGQVIGIDPRPGGMMLARVLPADLRAALNAPDTVLVDAADAASFRARPGSHLEINGRLVRVAGITSGLGAIGGPNIVASLDTARQLKPMASSWDDTTFLLMGLRHPEQAARVRDALQPTGTPRFFQIWTEDEFSRRSQRYWLLETGMGLGFAFSSGLALLIGVVITNQTLKAAIHASRSEYATLRALGVSRADLRNVVLEQSAWVGLLGIVVTTGVTVLLVNLAHALHVPMASPSWAYVGSAVFVFAIALVSGLFSLRALASTEPASLLR